MKKFLIINPFGIGDVLFTTPVIRAIRDAYPDSIIGYWCNERAQDIFKNDPDINKIFALSRGDLKKAFQRSWLEGINRFWSFISKIKKEKFEVSLDFSLDHRYGLISKLAGIKRRVGFNYKNRGRFLTEKIDIDGYKDRHVVEYYLELLKFLKISAGNSNLYLFLSETNQTKARIKLKSYYGIHQEVLLIGIAPGAGASWGREASIKHWPPLKYAQLADRLISELGAKVLILGDESERYIADIIVSAMKNKAVDLAGKTSLEELAAMISQLNILITNDGGPLHIAVALGKETVSIFGPVDEKVYGPYPPSSSHRVIKKDLSCRPCYNSFRFTGCTNNRECIQGIRVDEVFQQVKEIIIKC